MSPSTPDTDVVLSPATAASSPAGTRAGSRGWPRGAVLAPTLLWMAAVNTACLQLSPVRVEPPAVGHAPTVDFATILPEVGPGIEEVTIGEGCQDRPFAVGTVYDVDGTALSFRFFMLFDDPVQGELGARQELSSGQLVPLANAPGTFVGPSIQLGREELAREFRFGLQQLVSTGDNVHVLELVVSDLPFASDPDSDELPTGAGQVRVTWPFFISDVACTAPAGGQ